MNARLGRLKNFLFAVLAAVLFFGFFEIGLRLAKFEHFLDSSPIFLMNKYQLGDIIRYDQDMLWSLRPGGRQHSRARECINRLGFRGAEVSLRKSPGELRVACMGDSSTYGLCVEEKDTWPEQLRGILARRLSGGKVSVVNAGIMGYTSTQALARFKRDVLPLHPDVVVVMVGAVNEAFESFTSTDVDRIRQARKGDSLHSIRLLLMQSRTAQFVQYLLNRAAPPKMERRPFVLRVPVEQFYNDLDAFAVLAEQNHFRLILMSPPRKAVIERQYGKYLFYTQAIHNMAMRRGVPLVDVRDDFQKAGEGANLSCDNWHPNRQGNARIAAMLAEKIIQLQSPSARGATK